MKYLAPLLLVSLPTGCIGPTKPDSTTEEPIKETEAGGDRYDNVPMVRIDIKNTGNRCLDGVDTKVCFKDAEDNTIFERTYAVINDSLLRIFRDSSRSTTQARLCS